MISRDRITDVQEAVGALDAINWLSGGLGRLEERWVVDVGGGVVPAVELAGWGIEVLPHLAAVKNSIVGLLEHVCSDDRVGDSGNLVTSRPDVPEENVLARLVLSKRLLLEVEVDGASKSIGNDERR